MTVFYDLNHQLQHGLATGTVAARMIGASNLLLPCGVVALNGIPIMGGNQPTYFGQPVSAETVREQFNLGLGLGGVLTHMNRSRLSLPELASKSKESGHLWAYRNMTVTLCLSGAPIFVETSFHLSWVENKIDTTRGHCRIFTATGSLHQWGKYTAHRDSLDFLSISRQWLLRCHDQIQPLLP